MYSDHCEKNGFFINVIFWLHIKIINNKLFPIERYLFEDSVHIFMRRILTKCRKWSCFGRGPKKSGLQWLPLLEWTGTFEIKNKAAVISKWYNAVLERGLWWILIFFFKIKNPSFRYRIIINACCINALRFFWYFVLYLYFDKHFKLVSIVKL